MSANVETEIFVQSLLNTNSNLKAEIERLQKDLSEYSMTNSILKQKVLSPVWCVFECFSDGDGLVGFDLRGVFSIKENAIRSAKLCAAMSFTGLTPVPAHKNMNADNQYVCVGYRYDCITEMEDHIGGFLIEAVVLQ